MSSAGMPPVMIYRKKENIVEEEVMKGMPLGTIENFPYNLRSTMLNPGDTILMMSDGYPELMNENKELFGYKRASEHFLEVANESPENIIKHLKEQGNSWSQNREPDDDITFVVLKLK